MEKQENDNWHRIEVCYQDGGILNKNSTGSVKNSFFSHHSILSQPHFQTPCENLSGLTLLAGFLKLAAAEALWKSILTFAAFPRDRVTAFVSSRQRPIAI